MRVSRSSLRRRTSSFEIRALLLFFTLYILAALYLRKYYSWRDPGSFFFDIDRAYEPRYSAHRTYQANNYITSGPPKYEKAIEDPNPHICVGIATVARENGVGYFHTTVGSALQGLTPDERRRIYLALLIANTDPTKHEAYSTSWFYDVADAALTYEELPQDKLDHLRQLEQGDAFISKAIKDYTYLLKHCIAKGAAYIAMVEDDTAFQDGWLHRTEQAIREIESSSDPNYLYLRLFWTERYFGWNKEEWPKYFFWSVSITLSVGGILFYTRRFAPSTSDKITNRNISVVCLVWMPLCIALYFLAGKTTMQPMPKGVVEMNRFGCCSQGLLFPHDKAEKLVEWYEKHSEGYVDALTEEFGNNNDLRRYAISPPVIQHIGIRSSKNDDAKWLEVLPTGWVTPANKLWNFAFELQDPQQLKLEHEAANAAILDGI